MVVDYLIVLEVFIMIEVLKGDIYRVEVPLKGNPLKALFSYFIKGEDRNLIIDTGFNSCECRKNLFGAIEELGMDLEKTDVIITHLHSDHCGLAYELEKHGAKIYASEVDGKTINNMTKEEYWDTFRGFEKEFGLEVDNTSFTSHPGYKYCPKNTCDFTYLYDGDILKYGKYSLKVVETPGHTPGVIGLYCEEEEFYFSSDHILGRITPNIAYWGDDRDDLKIYLGSLEKISKYSIKEVYTPHRHIVYDIDKRIGELRNHHDERLKEVISILKADRQTPRDIASQMQWSLTCRDWSEFPDAQKWFATSEAMSHLQYLYHKGDIKKEIIDGTFYFSMNK